jgi:hypothetical protein
MSTRTSLLAISALVAGIAGLVGIGCRYCTFDGERRPSIPLDVGVDVDLHAVVRLDELVGNRYYEQLAVGEAAHDDAAIDQTLAAADEAFAAMG